MGFKSTGLVVALWLAMPGQLHAQPPAGYNQVKANNIFKDHDPGGWAGSGTGSLEVSPASTLPVDSAETYAGLPSLRLNVQAPPSWWTALIVPRNWATADISDYYANGTLEFNIRGNAGGESFAFALGDRAFERSVNGQPTDSVKSLTRAIGDVLPGGVTTSWQHVAVPLAALIPAGSPFQLNALWTLELYGTNQDSFKVWLNDIKFTTPDKERQYPQIKVNQVGYTADAEKYATVTGWYEDMKAFTSRTTFQVRRADDNVLVHTGKLTLVTNYERYVSGEKILTADFSNLRRRGTYYIRIAGLPDSPAFGVGNHVFDGLLRDAQRYYYLQRANIDLTEPFAEGWSHPAWHLDDADAPLQSTSAIRDNVSKGWYDAGDFGKYASPSATAASDLLWAYETFPRLFRDGQLNIPESGNGVPDLLDEVRYELDFLLNLQDEASFGFWSRVFPQGKNEGARYISDIAGGQTQVKPTSHSAAAVAALAHAAVVFRALDPAYAMNCLIAARNGWTYLENNPATVPSPSGPYIDDDDANDRFWAAAELFRATGDDRYHRYFLANYQSFAAAFSQTTNAHGVGSMEMSAFLAYLKSGHRNRPAVRWITAKFNEWKSYQLSRAQGPWRNTNDDATDYYWGSNAPILNTSMDLVIGTRILDDSDRAVARTVRSNLHYVLGINPMSFSYVSGHGANPVSKVFSGIYSDDGKPGLPPGYLAGGTNQYEGAWFSRFSGKCYLDNDGEWTTNEHTIYWNAGLVFSAAFMKEDARKR